MWTELCLKYWTSKKTSEIILKVFYVDYVLYKVHSLHILHSDVHSDHDMNMSITKMDKYWVQSKFTKNLGPEQGISINLGCRGRG